MKKVEKQKSSALSGVEQNEPLVNKNVLEKASTGKKKLPSKTPVKRITKKTRSTGKKKPQKKGKYPPKNIGDTGFGRPPAYDIKYCRELVDYMKQGYGLDEFAAKIMVTRTTLYNWSLAYPDFLNAVRLGKQLSANYWLKVLRASAQGKNLRAEVDGVEQDITNVKNINNSSLLLMVRNKIGWTPQIDVNVKQDPMDKLLEGEIIEGEEEHDVASPERLGEIVGRYSGVLKIASTINKNKRRKDSK